MAKVWGSTLQWGISNASTYAQQLIMFGRQILNHRIAIVGWSLGGAATLLASPLDIDALVLESVYPTISEAVHNRISMRLGPLSYVLSPILVWELQIRSGITPSELCPIDHIADVDCPVLIASGDADQHTTFAEAQRMFDTAREPKQLVVFQGATHTDLLEFNRKQYEDEVLPFLATYLASPKAECSAANDDQND